MKIVYTPEAVTQRLRMLDNLRQTCLLLAGPRLKWNWRQRTVSAAKRNIGARKQIK